MTAAPLHPSRATELTTRSETVRAFLRMGSPRVLLMIIAVTAIIRIVIGQWAWSNLVFVAITAAITGPVEWLIHLFLLHCPVDSFRYTKIGVGVSHRRHHLDPPDLENVVLCPSHAAVFMGVLTVAAAGWSALVANAAGWPLLPAMLSAVLISQLGLAHYEWTHLISHTTYRPKARYYATKVRHHRLHHYRNERYWLGVTSNVGDRLLRSLPRTKGAVPLSPTARTLDP